MDSPSIINSKEVQIEERDESQMLKHIYIGVFFDGTNNNMVQKMIYSSSINMSLFGKGRATSTKQTIITNRISELKNKKSLFQYLISDFCNKTHNDEYYDGFIKDIEKEINGIDQEIKNLESLIPSEKNLEKIYELRGELHKANIAYMAQQAAKNSNPLNINYSDFVSNNLKKEIESIENKINDLSSTVDVSESELMDKSSDDGFSNIAVLYSLFDTKQIEKNKEEETTKATKFYIEGSGASDLTNIAKPNANGLGFGLGLTGVTALVSKAITYVTNYVEPMDASIDENTKIHFYVFGFSRGATCARLFTHIATRRNDERLSVRESEFKDFLSTKLFDNGKVKFLEGITKLSWSNITVDFLGIYDTVASIGFLRQKDGWSDVLRTPYANMPNYKNNWHYKNVTQYGLYLNKDTNKLQYICHIGALDEYRENFAFTNIGKEVQSNAIEILMPGCHSDVGGGYMNQIEQEIVLPFYTEKNERKIRTSLILNDYTKKPTTKSFITTPGNEIGLENYEKYVIGTKSLEYVGWISNWDVEKTKNKSERLNTQSVSEHNKNLSRFKFLREWNFLNKVYFKRYVKRGWSDVALTMMIEKCHQKHQSIFKDSVIYDYRKTLEDKEIRELADYIVNKTKSASWGKRYWAIPDNDISSPKYKKLRLNYIHFTSSGSLFHLKNPFRNMEINSIIDGSGGNIGNKPNFDLDGNLCRITYNGDRISSLESNEESNSHSEHVYYMYDIESSNRFW